MTNLTMRSQPELSGSNQDRLLAIVRMQSQLEELKQMVEQAATLPDRRVVTRVNERVTRICCQTGCGVLGSESLRQMH